MYQPANADVEVRVQYSNRRQSRVYFLSGESWQATKDAVKAAGGKLDGSRRCWNLTGAALKQLKASGQVQVNASDFVIVHNSLVAFRFSATGSSFGEVLYQFDPLGDGTAPEQNSKEVYNHLAEVADTLQAAYIKSDDEFLAVARALPQVKHYHKMLS